MKYTPAGSAWLFIFFAFHITASVAIALLAGSKRVIGGWSSLVVCLLTSAIIGLLITLCFKTKQQKQVEDALNSILSGNEDNRNEMKRLKVLRQSGVISRKEYEEEVNRLLNL